MRSEPVDVVVRFHIFPDDSVVVYVDDDVGYANTYWYDVFGNDLKAVVQEKLS